MKCRGHILPSLQAAARGGEKGWRLRKDEGLGIVHLVLPVRYDWTTSWRAAQSTKFEMMSVQAVPIPEPTLPRYVEETF